MDFCHVHLRWFRSRILFLDGKCLEPVVVHPAAEKTIFTHVGKSEWACIRASRESEMRFEIFSTLPSAEISKLCPALLLFIVHIYKTIVINDKCTEKYLE